MSICPKCEKQELEDDEELCPRCNNKNKSWVARSGVFAVSAVAIVIAVVLGVKAKGSGSA